MYIDPRSTPATKFRWLLRTFLRDGIGPTVAGCDYEKGRLDSQVLANHRDPLRGTVWI